MTRSDPIARPKFFSRSGSLLALAGYLVSGCSGPLADAPNIVVPLPGESEPSPPKPAREVPSLEKPAKEMPPSDTLGSAPDPEAIPSAEWFELVVRYERGKVTLLSSRRLKIDSPRLPDRKVGRFAVELFAGNELVERVRFEFPLLADERDGFESGLTAEAKVLVPDRSEARGARLFDRKTGSIVALSDALWPSMKETAATASEKCAADASCSSEPSR